MPCIPALDCEQSVAEIQNNSLFSIQSFDYRHVAGCEQSVAEETVKTLYWRASFYADGADQNSSGVTQGDES